MESVPKERGQSLAEVGLIVGLLSVLCIIALSVGGTSIQGFYQQVAQSLSTSRSNMPGLTQGKASIETGGGTGESIGQPAGSLPVETGGAAGMQIGGTPP